MRHRLRTRFFVFALITLLIVCSLPAAAQDEAMQPTQVRIMTFNIWIGGDVVDFGKIVEAIQLADVDIVNLQEPNGNTRRVAEALGWQHVSERMHIISRFPLIDPPDANGLYLFAQIAPGQVIAVSNTHLPSDPYGPYLVREGQELAVVLQNEEETRMPTLEPFLDRLPMLVEAGYPVLLTGDFNTPSHLDWTEAAVEGDAIRYAVKWPVTAALEGVGFVDTYRAVHPDPTKDVGMTWTPGYPVPRLRDNEVVDRIDLIFASENIEVIDSQIVGEAGGQDVDIGVSPWPSDHRAVVSTVMVTPLAPPLFTALDQQIVRVGEPIVVRYAAPNGESEDRIVIISKGATPDDALMSLPPAEADFYGAITFGSATLATGEYEAVGVDGDGNEWARNNFWVIAQDAAPQIRSEKATYTADEPIIAQWENAPDNRFDWVGIFQAGDSDLYNYYGFMYTGQTSSGSLAFEDLSLEAGDYEVRLMLDDSYIVLASAPFTIGE